MCVKLKLNGKEIALRGEISVAELLSEHGYDSQRVAVEKNGGIVPKKNYTGVMLADGDKIEVVHFVGGG